MSLCVKYNGWGRKVIATRHPGHYIYHPFLDIGLAI
jgi:hypothetical protein